MEVVSIKEKMHPKYGYYFDCTMRIMGKYYSAKGNFNQIAYRIAKQSNTKYPQVRKAMVGAPITPLPPMNDGEIEAKIMAAKIAAKLAKKHELGGSRNDYSDRNSEALTNLQRTYDNRTPN